MYLPAWVEVGPRDGLQNEKTNVPTGEKIALIEALAAAGLKRLEATSFVSPRAIPQLADAEDVLAGLRAGEGVVYGGLIPNERGYERAKAAGVGEVVLVGAATESYCRKNLNMSVDEALAGFAPVAARGREDGIHARAGRREHRGGAGGRDLDLRVDLERLMDAADLLERLVGRPLNTRIERPLLADPGADG